MKNDQVEAKWGRLLKEMESIRARNEFCLLAGDLNKLIGCDQLGVQGNHPELSHGGKLLRSLLATKNWYLVNGLGEEVVVGGPFTREDPATGKLSCLDLFVASKELLPFVSKLEIDSNRKWAIARSIGPKKKPRLIYPDHFPSLLTLSNLPRRQEKSDEKTSRWNLAKEGGWKSYTEVTERYTTAVDNLIEDKESNIEETKHKFDKILDKIRFKSFGKVTINKKEKYKKKPDDLSNKTEEDRAIALREEETKRANEELRDIKEAGPGKVGMIWKIRKKVIGAKKGEMEATAIVNPATNKLVVSRSEVKEVTLKYCVDTLKNYEPEEAFVEHIEKKKELVKNFLNLKDGNFSASFDTFKSNVAKFKKSGKRNYDFLTRAGKGFQSSIFKFCQRMFDEECFPSDFEETTLHMVYKSRGLRTILSNNRFIHCKLFFPRVAESLVVEDGLKTPLLEGSSIYQIGGQPRHRSEELIFVAKSIMAIYKKTGRILVLNFFDLAKYFDKEMVEDAVLTCIRRKADPKAIRLWYKLNDNTRIQVRTGAGMSKKARVGAVLGQGTLAGALISQAVLDDGVMDNFSPGEEGLWSYGSVPLAPVMWQDDLCCGNESLEAARSSTAKVDFLVKQRNLRLNEDKTVCLILGSRKQKTRASLEIEENPIKCGNFEVKESQLEKWLGQYISAKGLSDSVAQTVKARESKIRGACLEIANIVNDWRSKTVGGMETALLLWERCCIPSLLHGAGTWMEISKETVETLNTLQRWFHRLIYQVGPGAALASLCWDSGCIDMGLRVKKEKVMMILFLRELDEETLSHRIMEQQQKMGWPGLVREAREICEELNIEDCNVTRSNKKQYKEILEEACKFEDEKILRALAEGKEKCVRMMGDKYGKKEYLSNKNIHQVRQQYRTRAGLQPFAGNYSHHKKCAESGLLCRCGEKREDESHLMWGNCPVYRDIREQYQDFDDDEDLVNFFTQVLDRREELDREEEEEKEEEKEEE